MAESAKVKRQVTPSDGKLHARRSGVPSCPEYNAWSIELRPDPRTPEQDATAVVAVLAGPDPEKYALVFAAAPDLFIACKGLLRVIEEYQSGRGEQSPAARIQAARDAIMKAVGP